MNTIKVLIVDDSAVIRAGLTNIFSKDNEIEVVGTAPDPIIAMEKIKRLNPDVITLDIEMPKMDGITFLKSLMKEHPMPVIMISTWTKANSDKAIQSLSLGAFDCIEKPKSADKLKELEDEIISKVKIAAKTSKDKVTRVSSNVTTSNTIKTSDGKTFNKDKLILIGASTGGTVAIENILKSLPKNMPGIVVVLHMPMYFTNAYAQRLDTLCELTVKEAKDGEQICPGTAYIAQGGMQCYVQKVMGGYKIKIADDERVNNHKPSVDSLFHSAAQDSCRNIIGVILTGMGKDGAKGMLEMRKADSYNIGQDEASSVVYGMPREAYNIGAVHEVLSIDNIAERLYNLSR